MTTMHPAVLSQTVHWTNTTPRSMRFTRGEYGPWRCEGLATYPGIHDRYPYGARATVHAIDPLFWRAVIEDDNGYQVGPAEFGDSFENAALHLLLTLPPAHYGSTPYATPVRTVTGTTIYGATPGAHMTTLKLETLGRATRHGSNFLPALFGRSYLRGESTVYAAMEKASRDYAGGMWSYCVTPQGHRYMRPKVEKRYRMLGIGGNGSQTTMSADGAGIAITLLVLNRLGWHEHANGNDTAAAQLFDNAAALQAELRDTGHPDLTDITTFLD